MLDRENKGQNIRIVDIAKAAGVSTGTVDRVIHKRGKVAKDKLEKVERAIEELHYEPNVTAQYLAFRRSKTVVIYAIIPNLDEGGYWQIIDSGIAKATREVNNYGVRVEKIHYDQNDRNSFVKLTNSLIQKDEICGVLIAPLFREETEHFVAHLHSKGIPYVYIDSNNVGDDTYLAYFGIQSFDSGKIVAKLMTSILNDQQDVLKVHFKKRDEAISSSKTELIDAGFTSYINEQIDRPLSIHHLDIYVDENNTDKTLDEFFREHDKVGGIVVYNSRAHIIADYLMRKGIKTPKIIGFDLLENNIKYLKEGTILYLISQRPDLQGYFAIKTLSDSLVLGTSIQKTNYIPIDVLMKENVDYFLNWNH